MPTLSTIWACAKLWRPGLPGSVEGLVTDALDNGLDRVGLAVPFQHGLRAIQVLPQAFPFLQYLQQDILGGLVGAGINLGVGVALSIGVGTGTAVGKAVGVAVRVAVGVGVAVLDFAGMRIPVAGGGFWRMLPAWAIRRAVRRIEQNRRSFVFYLHPHEFDDRPLKSHRGLARNVYVNLGRGSVRERLRSVLNGYDFRRFPSANAPAGPQ